MLKKAPKRVIFALIFITIILSLSVWAYLTTSQITRDVKDTISSGEAHKEQIKVDDLIITETHQSAKYWEVYAKTGDYDNTRSNVILTDIIGNFYKDDKVVMSFRAPKGLYNSKIKEIKLSGGTLLVTDDETSISSDELVWVGTNDEIHATGNVEIVKQKEVVSRCSKSIFNKDFTYFKVMGNSKTELYSKE